jgi:GNAT superfamily N-acetyltransferase
MHIEKATLADVLPLSDLLGLLFAQEAEFKPNSEAQIRGLTRLLTQPELGFILLARDNGQVVGMVNILYTISTALGERVALLEDMVVRPEARGVDMGSKLLARAIELACVAGCQRITLLTDHDNVSAQRFYQRQGFVISSMMPLRLSL